MFKTFKMTHYREKRGFRVEGVGVKESKEAEPFWAGGYGKKNTG